MPDTIINDPPQTTEAAAREALAELVTRHNLPEPAEVRWSEHHLGGRYAFVTVTTASREDVAAWAKALRRKAKTEQYVDEWVPGVWSCLWDVTVELRNWLPEVRLRVEHVESRTMGAAAAGPVEQLDQAVAPQRPAGLVLVDEQPTATPAAFEATADPAERDRQAGELVQVMDRDRDPDRYEYARVLRAEARPGRDGYQRPGYVVRYENGYGEVWLDAYVVLDPRFPVGAPVAVDGKLSRAGRVLRFQRRDYPSSEQTAGYVVHIVGEGDRWIRVDRLRPIVLDGVAA